MHRDFRSLYCWKCIYHTDAFLRLKILEMSKLDHRYRYVSWIMVRIPAWAAKILPSQPRTWRHVKTCEDIVWKFWIEEATIGLMIFFFVSKRWDNRRWLYPLSVDGSPHMLLYGMIVSYFYWPPTNTYSRLIIKPRSYKNRCPRRGVGCSRWNTIVCWLPRSESTWQSIPMAEHSWTKFERRPRALWAFYTRCCHSSWSSCYVGPKSLRTKVSTKKYILDVRIRILRCAAPIHVKGVI